MMSLAHHIRLLPLLFIVWWSLFTPHHTYNNSSLSADTINLASSKDTNIEGANIHGAKATNLNVGGNLNVASLQDRHTQKSVGVDVSLSYTKENDTKASTTHVGKLGKTDFSIAQGGGGKGSTTSGSLNAHASRGNYQAVTNQTGITGGKVTINTQGNTHLKGALIKGEEATSITTATLTAEDIVNKADFHSMSGGVSYASSTTSSEKPEANNNHSKKPEEQRAKGLTPNIGLPQEVEKSSTTHTAIADNTVINITDQANQKQDTDTISRDTEHASYAMTEINTEVLNIRADISKEVSKDGFKAVGDLAMEEDWKDGSIEKTLAHAAMGAAVAAIGNGDALSGAVGAGAAEAARPATKDADDATQQTVSAVVGAIAGGGTGASTGLDGEKYNRQLHQREIAWIEQNAEAFAQANGMTPEQAKQLLTLSALGLVDGATSIGTSRLIKKGYLGNITQEDILNAQNYIKGHTVGGTYQEHYDDSFPPAHPMFEATQEEYNSHSYNPNTPRGGLGVSPALEMLPIGKVGSLVKFRVDGGNALVKLKDGRTVEVPAEAIGKDNSGRIFINRTKYQAPHNGTGNIYTVFQRDIDLDTEFQYTNNRGRTITTTNRQLMSNGNAPYVEHNGRMEQVQLHHSRQDSRGPLFEVTESTHSARTNQGREALHPYTTNRGRELNGQGGGERNSLHPYYPVDRASFNIDRNNYWIDRLNNAGGN